MWRRGDRAWGWARGGGRALLGGGWLGEEDGIEALLLPVIRGDVQRLPLHRPCRSLPWGSPGLAQDVTVDGVLGVWGEGDTDQEGAIAWETQPFPAGLREPRLCF